MNMSFNNLKTQHIFEDILKNYFNTTNLNNISSKLINSLIIKGHNNIEFSSSLKSDSKDYFFKGFFSLLESLTSINRKYFSWATVKLYYSIFYFTRSFLNCKDIIIVRFKRDFFYFRNNINLNPIKIPGTHKNDHKASFYVNNLLFPNEFLLTNLINGISVYDWMMQKREEINYKNRTFHEPIIPDFLRYFYDNISKGNTRKIIYEYLHDDSYCFDDDHICVSVPIKRMQLTYAAIIEENLIPVFSNEKHKQIVDIATSNKYLLPLTDYLFEENE
jgi:hypothetical protein